MPGFPQTTRRTFLAGATIAAAGLALEACGGSSSSGTSTTTSGSGTPKTGGTLTMAATGGGSTDTLDPYVGISNVDYARLNQVYEKLAGYSVEGVVEPRLAEELTPNEDGTEWIVRLPAGLTFHDGQPVRPADVIASLNQMAKSGNMAGLMEPVDVAGSKALDERTVRVPMHTPLFTFPAVMANYNAFIAPADFDPKKANGTGPFKFESFTPGRESTFTRNPDYRESGKPYVDEIVISNFAEESAQLSALTSGQANLANNFSFASLGALQSGGAQLLTGDGGGSNPFYVNMSGAPYNDVRVRQALKLVVDRPKMLSTLFGEYGSLANDVWAPPFDILYHEIPQREQDIEQAKSLLSQAGQSDLSIELTTSPIAQGVVEAAQLYAQDASAAGIDVTINNVTPDIMFGPEYLQWPFAQDYWIYQEYLNQVANSLLPNSPFGESHFRNPRYVSLYKQAVAAADLNKRKEIAAEMQQIEFDEGTNIITNFVPVFDAYDPSVQNLQAGRVGQSFDVFSFTDVWIS